jgi:hypothetical protein
VRPCIPGSRKASRYRGTEGTGLPGYVHWAFRPDGGQPGSPGRFADGRKRDLYEDAEGRQYVQDNDGAKVYGLWLSLADEPFVAEQARVPIPRKKQQRQGPPSGEISCQRLSDERVGAWEAAQVRTPESSKGNYGRFSKPALADVLRGAPRLNPTQGRFKWSEGAT